MYLFVEIKLFSILFFSDVLKVDSQHNHTVLNLRKQQEACNNLGNYNIIE